MCRQSWDWMTRAWQLYSSWIRLDVQWRYKMRLISIRCSWWELPMLRCGRWRTLSPKLSDRRVNQQPNCLYSTFRIPKNMWLALIKTACRVRTLRTTRQRWKRSRLHVYSMRHPQSNLSKPHTIDKSLFRPNACWLTFVWRSVNIWTWVEWTTLLRTKFSLTRSMYLSYRIRIRLCRPVCTRMTSPRS